VKFNEGGWITLVVTGAVVALAFLVKSHYGDAMKDLKRLNVLVETAELPRFVESNPAGTTRITKGRTAIVFVNGFNGLGLHTFLGIPRLFPDTFGKFIFVQVGALDAGSFKGAEELERLKAETAAGVQRYVEFAQRHGFAAEAVTDVGHDIIGKITELSDALLKQHPNAVLFGGQLAFAKETIWTRWLHNYAVFALQRLFCRRGVPFIIVPAKI
jgi:hypothetical protein